MRNFLIQERERLQEKHKNELFRLHVSHQVEQQSLETRLKEETQKKQEEGKLCQVKCNTAQYHMIPYNTAGCTIRRPEVARTRIISGRRSKFKSTRNFWLMTAILWKNLNFIELITILQLITILNRSDVFARWQQYQTANNKIASWINFFSVLDTWRSIVQS